MSERESRVHFKKYILRKKNIRIRKSREQSDRISYFFRFFSFQHPLSKYTKYSTIIKCKIARNSIILNISAVNRSDEGKIQTLLIPENLRMQQEGEYATMCGNTGAFQTTGKGE